MLMERLERIAAAMQPMQFASLLDSLSRQMLDEGFRKAGADEGTIWLVDPNGEHLVPAYNTGPNAAHFVGKFRQPLNSGLICMVFASEQPFLENEVWKNKQQSKTLDTLLQVDTCSMAAVPFYFLRGCRGVISAVKLRQANGAAAAPPGFAPGALADIQKTAALVSQLIELRLLSTTVGWATE